MDKYIKYEDIRECRFFQDEEGEWILHADILKIPTADVVPVRHGKWIAWGRGGHKICSYCKRSCTVNVIIGNPNYCPNCGADMREE